MTIANYEILFRENYESLARYAFSILKNQEEAEDVVQRLFVKFWEKRNEMESILDHRAYLFRSVYNSSLNQLKRMQRSQAFSGDGEAAVASSDAANHLVLSDELQSKIDQAVTGLPTKCQEVFRLSRFEDLSYKEISEHLDISIKTVENHMVKALRIMREELSEYLPLLIITLIVSKGW